MSSIQTGTITSVLVEGGATVTRRFRSVTIHDVPENLTPELVRAAPDLLATMRAIQARRRGDWDYPDLVAMGPLSVDWFADETKWIEAAIAKAEGRE